MPEVDRHSLRSAACFRAIHGALCNGNEKSGFRLIEYSVQSNHFHFAVEARSTRDLSRGMQGLAIRLARTVNRRLRRRGKVFRDRYHSRALRSPWALKNALRYILNNHRRHNRNSWRNGTAWVDPCSSAPFFKQWEVPPGVRAPPLTERDATLIGLGRASTDPRTNAVHTWYMAAGKIDVTEIPTPRE